MGVCYRAQQTLSSRVRFQLVVDCADSTLLARFWAAALGYVLEPPPAGFTAWSDYRRDVGIPEDELGTGADRIIDPDGGGREIPIESRRQRVGAEARRLSSLGATMVGILAEEGVDHYAVAMKAPEGNEFDIN